ncbi:uncharacterized protein LOC111047277 [Nilaparvata lugens]|uniref:uncharacterized protein LOC111047277 n=1 Tax=Nilaparvata lugens TaxID=108931 RepID=UPI00193DF362|nr:uncharacterized protein LOC111047277 [Nilaparvata lugens]
MFAELNNGLTILLLIFTNAEMICSEVIKGCSENLKSIPWKPCEFPDSRDHYYVPLDGGRRFLPKIDKLEGNGEHAVKVVCFDSKTKRSRASDLLVCFDGAWYPNDHGCVDIVCDPVFNTTSTNYSCMTQAGEHVSCVDPVPMNTQLTIHCSHWRYNPNGGSKVCLDGEWEKWEPCREQCGLVTDNIPQGINSSEAALLRNPWHVVIYRLTNGNWTQKCAGTIIEHRLIITAGVCLHPLSDPKSLKVAVGSYFKHFGTAKSSRGIHEVEQVFFNADNSIAMLRTKVPLQYSDTVGSACITRIHYNADPEYLLIFPILTEYVDTGFTSKETLVTRLDPSCSNRADERICSYSFDHRKVEAVNIGAGSASSIIDFEDNSVRWYLRGILIDSYNNSDNSLSLFTSIDVWKNREFIKSVMENLGLTD